MVPWWIQEYGHQRIELRDKFVLYCFQRQFIHHKMFDCEFGMNRTTQEEIEQIKNELANNHDIIVRNDQRLACDPWLQKQVIFWMESIRFLVTELEIWDRAGNETKYAETTLKIEKADDVLYDLLRQLD